MFPEIGALFSVKVTKQVDVAQLEEGQTTPETLTWDAAGALFESYGDKPALLLEAAGEGFVVAGERHAFLFQDTGDVKHAEIKTAPVEELALGGAMAVHIKALKAALAAKKVDEAQAALAKLEAACKVSSGTKVKAPANEASPATLSTVFAQALAVKFPEEKPEKLAAAVEAAKTAVIDKLAEGKEAKAGLSESLNEMALYPSGSYLGDNSVKVDGVTVEVYGPGLRFSTGDFIAKAPNYALSDYVIEKAIREVIEGDGGTAFVGAIRAALKGSDKVEPLEIELRESTDAPLDESVVPAKPITETDEVAVVVWGEGVVELRAGKDGKGEVLASVSFEEGTEGQADTEIAAKAKELGYEYVPVTEQADTFLAQASDFVVSMTVEHRDANFSKILSAIDEALAAGDGERLATAIELMTETAKVEVPTELIEGLRARKHKAGRKPGHRTLVNKAKMGKIKPPVDVGISKGSGGTVSESATVVDEGKKAPPFVKKDTAKDDEDDEDDEDEEDLDEDWAPRVRDASVEEFTALMLEAAARDTKEVFAARVAKLSEMYESGPGKKDIARKVTAANAVIKGKLGKGLSLESVKEKGESTTVTFPKARFDAFSEAAKVVGVGDSAIVKVVGESFAITMKTSEAAKLLTLFTGEGVTSAPTEAA